MLAAGFARNPGERWASAHWSAIRLTQTRRGIATDREADASRSPKESSYDDKIPNVCRAKLLWSAVMNADTGTRRWKIADFSEIAPVPCPCGIARRAFQGITEFPGTLHITEISEDAKRHYHKTLTETYVFLKCEPDARMELDGEVISIRQHQAIVIPPGVRHRALGRMTVLIIVLPEFDPADEWFD